MEAVRGLMTPSHAAAVRAAAAGNIEAAAAAGSKRETLADVTVTAANSSGLNGKSMPNVRLGYQDQSSKSAVYYYYSDVEWGRREGWRGRAVTQLNHRL